MTVSSVLEKPDDHQKNKKKSFLSLRRRRTTEMRLGPDGKIITAPYFIFNYSSVFIKSIKTYKKINKISHS